MKSRFLPNKENDSILNYFALPIVGLCKSNFKGNLESVKINFDGTILFVQIKDDVYPDILYPNKIKGEDSTYLFFKIPIKFINDTKKIILGEYSKMSSDLKDLIRFNSGLYYNSIVNGKQITSKLIFAFEKDPKLISHMYELLKSPLEKLEKYNRKLWEMLCEGELTEKLDEDDFYFNINTEVYGIRKT